MANSHFTGPVVSQNGIVTSGTIVVDGTPLVMANIPTPSTPVTLEASQIMQLAGTPIEIVPAQGVGTYIIPQFAVMTTDDFTPYDNGDPVLVYTESGGQCSSVYTGYLTTSNRAGTLQCPSSSYEPVENSGVSLTVATGNPINGDNTMWIKVYYIVVSGLWA